MPGSRALWPLLACQALLTAGLALSYPFFALYLHRDRGLPMGWVGFWLFAMTAAGAAAAYFGGELSDTRGPRAVMTAALLGRAAFVGGLAVAVWTAAPLWIVVALHVAGGCVGHLFDPAIRSWIAARVPPQGRVTLYGRQRVAVNVGWAVGPALGGLLAAESYALTFAATSALCLLCAGVAAFGLPADASARAGDTASASGILAAGRDARFLRFCAWSLVLAIVTAQLVAPLSVHAVQFVGLTERQVGALFAINGVLVILGVVPAAQLPMSLTAALAAGCGLYAAGYALVGFAPGFWTLALAMVVLTLGEIVVSPRMPTLTAELAPANLVGRYIGFQGLCFTGGQALAPLLGGAGLQHLSPRWTPAPWLIIGALGAAAAAGFSRFGRSVTQGGRLA